MSFDVVVFLNASVFLVAATMGYIFTFFFIGVSHRFKLLDYPEGRKIHARPMPFLGGAALFASFWATVFGGIAAIVVCSRLSPRPLFLDSLSGSVMTLLPKMTGIFVGGLVIFLVGIYDDKFRWTPVRKLAGQCLAAVILMSLGLTINLVQSLGPLGYGITFVWILMIMNAFNFIDSLDGHCAGIALISSLTFFWITQIINQPLVGFLLASFAGALSGFLPHNFKPAKIFLGDNGSLFIGYLMAAFTLLCRYQVPQGSYATLFIPVLVFGVPIYDTMSVIIVRLVRGSKPWEGDRNHFAHRLVKMGMSDRVAVVFSYFIEVTIGLVALLTTQVDFFGAVLVGLIFFSIIGVIAFLEYYATDSLRRAEELAMRHRRRRDDPRH
ncbi:MAG TPA: MraY family glycosyltransferase [Candidatus Eisenbacteria bacterium]|nr:MraY family glycosyltransferase [Candidatus Eisenbacteria bacterium]